jgi:hypothetical protein
MLDKLALMGLAERLSDGGGILMLLGRGDGTFRAAYGEDGVDQPAVITSGDTNGDGLPELLVADGHAQLLTLVNSSY